MGEKFDLFRLSLTKRILPQDLFEDKKKELTREEYIKEIFSKNFQISHYGTTFYYVPSGESNNILLGSMGKRYTSDENLPPEQGLKPSSHEGWKAAVIIIDPREHQDGQKVSMNHDRLVGKPRTLLSSIIKYFNENINAPFHIEIEPIFSPKSFWDFAKKHKGNITSLTFEFVTPNMFGSSDEVSEELKKFRDLEKAQRVEVSLKSSDGLEIETNKIRNSVDYVTKGTGKITASARGGEKYNSTKQTAYATLLASLNSGESLLERAVKNISRLLGREQNSS